MDVLKKFPDGPYHASRRARQCDNYPPKFSCRLGGAFSFRGEDSRICELAVDLFKSGNIILDVRFVQVKELFQAFAVLIAGTDHVLFQIVQPLYYEFFK